MLYQQYNGITYLQFEHFRQINGLRHGVFTRQGGVSQGNFHSLNIGLSVGDTRTRVEENRARALTALGCTGLPLGTARQVHGNDVIEATKDWKSQRDNRIGFTYQGDGLVTGVRELILLMSFADCTPLLFFAPRQTLVALAHAGWRGTAAGIAGATVRKLQATFGVDPADLLVGIGPAIGSCCYQVSQNVIDTFAQAPEPRHPLIEQRQGRFYLDLWETNRQQLLAAGVQAPQIDSARLCTACHTDLFYSHRAERGQTGRFAVLLGVV